MPKMFALVCFADGDARVYRYNARGENIENLPDSFIEKKDELVTSITFDISKKRLIQMARLAHSEKWREEHKGNDETDMT